MPETFAFAAAPPKRRRIRKVAALTLAWAGIAGIAFAAWTVNSPVTGYVKAGTLAPLQSVNISATVPAELYPGQTGALHLRVTNSNTGPVTITTMVQNGSPVSSDTSACPSSNLSTISPRNGLSFVIPGGGAPTDIDISGAVSMNGSAPSGCQGIGWSVPVILMGTT